jgi:hypothetical protein
MSDDATAPTSPIAAPAAVPERAADLVLARVHLRLGSLALARAELETLAGLDALDPPGIIDLAEARWRSGDLEGAGEAAALVLEDEEGPLLALIIAAEAAAGRGRPTEARRLAAKALAAADGRIDQLFAGMPRSPAWPPDPAAPPPSPTTMFDPPPGTTVRQTTHPSRSAERVARRREVRPPSAEAPGSAALAMKTASASTLGLWGDDEGEEPTDAALPSGADALELGREALESGDLDGAATQLALVLRLSSALAPAVLDLLADRSELQLAFVRGDAFRLVGREIDARRAYARAVGPASSADPAHAPAADPTPDGADHPMPDTAHEGDPT